MKNLIWIILFSSFFISCSNAIYENNIDFESEVWHLDSSLTYTFEIEDINSEYEILYVFRNNLDYPYHNLFIQNFLYSPNNNKIISDIQEVILMDKKTGKPYGKGFAGIYQNKFIAISSLQFTEKGTYTFRLKQYMREETLGGILSVGIVLNKLNKK